MREKGQTEVAKTLETPVFSRGIEILTEKAGFLCEVNSEHPVFVRKNSNENYTEPHHLVPLFAQKDFPNVNLDREQNIVSLCSHCHNLLHYGADIDGVLYKLYMDRKDLLQLIGIEISYEDLKKYYL